MDMSTLSRAFPVIKVDIWLFSLNPLSAGNCR